MKILIFSIQKHIIPLPIKPDCFPDYASFHGKFIVTQNKDLGLLRTLGPYFLWDYLFHIPF